MALSLAENGIYSTKPNPRVGCVLVKDNQLLGQGWHERAGSPHAEVMALQDAQKNSAEVAGATAYINLEPCSHQGKTAPCADALIKAKIGEVYVAMQDPNPLVSGAGLAKLRAAGIKVSVGLLEEEAITLNRGFVQRHGKGRPWVTLKTAQSLDGVMVLSPSKSPSKIEGKSDAQRPRWITGEEARNDVHLWRARSCAVISGASSISKDNSRLNVRVDAPATASNSDAKTTADIVQPLRIALDPKFGLSPKLDFFTTAGPKLWVGVTPNQPPANVPANTEILIMSHKGKTNASAAINLSDLLVKLSIREINEVLVESGPRLTSAFLCDGLVDEMIVYLSPSILRAEATTNNDMIFNSLSNRNSNNMSYRLKFLQAQKFGEDLRVILRPEYTDQNIR